ncbi:MAG TPA: RNA-binding cell elongation regulator Jag/EloR [Acidimicrobiales bacterium]|nr:RNA-binding cell elongation regulator Jag/EloR [Acidimicrobiales bacterium]
MQWVETTGKSVDEATQAALAELGVSSSDAEVVVVSEPKPGLFGRVRAEARVRARVRPAGPPSKDGRRKPRGRDGGGRSRKTEKKASRPPSRATSDDGPGREQEKVMQDDNRADEVEVPLEEQGEVAAGFLEGLVESFGLEAQVTSTVIDEDTVRVAIDGGELGILIGPRGQALDALQDLTRTAVFRETGARHGWVVVDVSDYRAKRRTALERFTEGVAAEALEAGESRALEPMNPADRKIVHDTVNGIDGVRTSSEGEEPRRYVVIHPES